MKQYKCSICGYIHDEKELGEFSNLENYTCPICGAPKELFETDEIKEEKETIIVTEEIHEDRELSNLELSVICSNLSRGCLKQYLLKESEMFTKLADYFKSKSETVSFDKEELMNLINKDLEINLKVANNAATKHYDRGALRALTWSTKVTNILKILLDKYEDVNDQKVFVCSICGFIFIGDSKPELCPICKVQNDKFIEVEGE
ncbi:MAG: rubredoxin [Mycoplasmatota bacterium]